MTLQEYLQQNNLTPALFARQVDVYDRTIRKYLKGHPASKEVHAKLVALGIEHPLAIEPHLAPRKKVAATPSKTSTKMKNRITDRQVELVQTLGNTIISKKFSKSDIVKHFKQRGLDVTVTNFETVTPEDDTHYIVSLKKKVK